MANYKIGKATKREEDLRILRGRGRYVDDFKLYNMARGHVLRSPYAHAEIKSIDVSVAKASPGVLLVLTGDDYLRRGLGTLLPMLATKMSDGSDGFVTPQPLLATDRVRFVGEAVAFIVAETHAQAQDAAELINVEYSPLPSVIRTEDASSPDSVTLWEGSPNNEAFFHAEGDADKVDKLIAAADHVVRHTHIINRVTANTMEPRGAIAEYDAEEERYTIRCTFQSAFRTRAVLARQIFKIPLTNVHAVADNVGGGFGMKGHCYAEYAFCMWAAEILGRPVKWVGNREESLLTDDQARDNISEAELALDDAGKFLALRVKTTANIGAYFTSDRATGPNTGNLGSLAGTYTTKAVRVEVLGVMTNTMTTGHYRGAGRPEAAYVIEATIDKAARELNIDPVELRRINTIPAEALPYTTGLVFTYESGNFLKNLEDGTANADVSGFTGRREMSESTGKLRGMGITNTIERTAGGVIETAEIRFDSSGTMTLLMGTSDHGQGHQTTFKQVVSEKLGLDSAAIRYRDSDSDIVTAGSGTFGSRSAACGSAAIMLAVEKVIDKGRKIAAHMLEVAESDITFEDGLFTVDGTDKSVELADVARLSFQPAKLPNDVEPGLYEVGSYDGGLPTFPNGCHVSEVEIDRATGQIEIVKYTVVDDVGTVLNPLLLKGQIHGGIAQGVGQVLMEDISVDPASGQVITGSFMDYAMPRADNLCHIDISSNEFPTPNNPLGVKGAGEAGTVGSLPSVMNAINDALASAGAGHIEMPATAEKVWRALRQREVA